MPVHKGAKGKWKVGGGKANYKSKDEAKKVQKAVKAKKHATKGKNK